MNFSYWEFALVIALNGFGSGLFASPNWAEMMNSVPPDQRGAAGGMIATFQNSAFVLSIGIFFTLMVAGLSSKLPAAMFSGLTAQGVPAATAAPISHLPPIGVLFASFLGYNPMQQLLGPLLSHLPPAHAAYLAGREFFPHLITAPFHERPRRGLRVRHRGQRDRGHRLGADRPRARRRRPRRESLGYELAADGRPKAASSPASSSSPTSRETAPNRRTSPGTPAESGWQRELECSRLPERRNAAYRHTGPSCLRGSVWRAFRGELGGDRNANDGSLHMTTTQHASTIGLDAVAELAAQLRVDSVRSSTSAGSGHPTSSMSAADLLAVLVTRHLHYDWDEPALPVNDHLIFSKGHASPLLYSVFKAVGVVSDEELLTGYRRFGQRLEGHPTPVLPWVDVATGSLGQGLPDGVGVALAGKYLDAASLPGLGAVRGQRAGRGLDLGGVRQGLLLQAVEPDRDRRHQPARPAGRDRPRLEP